MNQEILQYIFHYNPHTKQWACVNRKGYMAYMNGMASYEDVVYADSVYTLLSQFHNDPKKNTAEEKEA